ncbi:aminoalkylphosphonate N-acetyltransferase [Aeromonas phage ZPAH34]|uniref:aminoalkylphosphonate N-acetyltransferase n=1 Tax=Aeromonas phage ZPAH34 TaxID=2924888 RepID=UPI0023299657|nr:aminoalkylphosphonate N-acetyltransferase [Aeromonas phage ZPAH34]UOX39509.1 aminoalkylphosphonate N-acetyltransferase [Aeromonas phage ZPAH34]
MNNNQDYEFLWLNYEGAIEVLSEIEIGNILTWGNDLINNERTFRTFPYEQEGNKRNRTLHTLSDLFFVDWEHAGIYLVVLRYKGQLVSVARVTYGIDDYSKELIITYVMTNPGFRKEGHGRELMERIGRGARMRNFSFLSLCYDGRNKDAVEFYTKTGWIKGTINAGKFL